MKELRELLHLDSSSNSCVIPGGKVAELEEAMKMAEQRPRKRLLDLMLKRRVPR